MSQRVVRSTKYLCVLTRSCLTQFWWRNCIWNQIYNMCQEYKREAFRMKCLLNLRWDKNIVFYSQSLTTHYRKWIVIRYNGVSLKITSQKQALKSCTLRVVNHKCPCKHATVRNRFKQSQKNRWPFCNNKATTLGNCYLTFPRALVKAQVVAHYQLRIERSWIRFPLGTGLFHFSSLAFQKCVLN